MKVCEIYYHKYLGKDAAVCIVEVKPGLCRYVYINQDISEKPVWVPVTLVYKSWIKMEDDYDENWETV